MESELEAQQETIEDKESQQDATREYLVGAELRQQVVTYMRVICPKCKESMLNSSPAAVEAIAVRGEMISIPCQCGVPLRIHVPKVKRLTPVQPIRPRPLIERP